MYLYCTYYNFFFIAHLELAEVTSKKKVNVSLRKCRDEDEQFNTFGVTPEFQKYIGKHLSAILDKKIEKNTISKVFNTICIKNESQAIGGIKLFSDSEYFLELKEYQVESNNNYVKHIRTHANKSHISKEDFRNLAVSGESILKKEDLKYWSKRTKGKIFSYKKLDNGQLMFLE